MSNGERMWLALAVMWSSALMSEAEDSAFWRIFYRVVYLGALVHAAVFVVRGFM